MQNQGGIAKCDSRRSAIDRRAVTVAGQLLMSAIWLEHRVRRVSTLLSMSPSQRASVVSAVRYLAAHQSDTVSCPFPTVGATDPFSSRERYDQ
jgi:hypothetical protein